MQDYYFVYRNVVGDTCFTVYYADDLEHAWEQFRDGDRDPEDQVLFMFTADNLQVLYQE